MTSSYTDCCYTTSAATVLLGKAFLPPSQPPPSVIYPVEPALALTVKTLTGIQESRITLLTLISFSKTEIRVNLDQLLWQLMFSS